MKATKLNGIIQNILLGIVTTLMIFSFTSCATKAVFSTSSVAPAAEGQVKIKRDHNENYVVKISVTSLVEVERLQPPKQTYVVWMVTDQDVTNNVGLLNSSKGFMSKTLNASFETVSSSKPIEIFITAENDGSTEYPSDQIVLQTNRF